MEKTWSTIYIHTKSPITISFEFIESETKDNLVLKYMEQMFDMRANDLKQDLESITTQYKNTSDRILKQKDAWSYEFSLTGPSIFHGVIKNELLEAGFVVNKESWKERFPSLKKDSDSNFVAD